MWSQGKLADKVYAGFTSSNTTHGGQETTLLTLYVTLMHFGGIIVPPGYTEALKFVDGNPYGASLVASHDNIASSTTPPTTRSTIWRAAWSASPINSPPDVRRALVR